MATRPSWKGYLRLSLVSVPVRGFTATASGGEIHLNQVHKDCSSRIRYKKTCPIHGEVPNDEIVSGYEFAKGQFVVIDPDELDQLRTESDKAIQISTFIEPAAVDPVYHSGQTYYLAPDGRIGEKAYVLLRDGLGKLGLHAIAQVVLHGKEKLVLLRPLGKLLAMTMLEYPSHVTAPAALEDQVPDEQATRPEMDLVETLIKSHKAKRFDLAEFKDRYTETLSKLIEAKVAGKEIVRPTEPEHVQIVNLMEALKQSVEKSRGSVEEAPPKRMAASQPRKAGQRKRKTS